MSIPMSKGYPGKSWEWDKPKTPQEPLTIYNLFPNFDRWAIGFHPLLDIFKEVSSAAKQSSYPPYNIRAVNESLYYIEIALAGFQKDDLNISLKGNKLKVTGNGLNSSFGNMEFDYVHQGIARRDFEQEFTLADHMEIKEAEFEDGLLTITIVRNLPEEKKPKEIKIK